MPSNRHLGRSRIQVAMRVARAAYANQFKEMDSHSVSESAVHIALDDIGIQRDDPMREIVLDRIHACPRPGLARVLAELESNAQAGVLRSQFGDPDAQDI